MKKKILFKKTHIILFVILAVGLFLRLYKAPELFLYTHDNDLSGWFVKDVIENQHLRLIGQETSTQGIFIGPVFYYLLTPFYLLFNFDPIGGVYLVSLVGLFTIWSFYFVLTKLFNKNTGLIAALLYAVSFYAVFNDREVVPTMPVILWTLWYLYVLDLVLKGNFKKGFVLGGILIGLIWHLNFALILVTPLLAPAFFLSKKKLVIKHLGLGLLSLFVTSIPLMLFELRHGFSQVNWFIKAMTVDQKDVFSGFDKLIWVIHLTGKNITGFLWGSLLPANYKLVFWLFILMFALAVWKKLLSKNLSIIVSGWIILYIFFFSTYTKSVSEYYLNGLMVIWILILSVVVTPLITINRIRIFGVVFLLSFTAVNIYRFFTIDINRSGYVDRKAIVAEIKKDAAEHGYPCIAISYITDPGYNLGYRYFFWLAKMHVNKPESGSPVYTIVFPMKSIFPHDFSSGAIGLIYPDYGRYTKEVVTESCLGDNSNITEPMFGFTN